MAIDFLSFGYAAVVAAGGVFGYIKAGEDEDVNLLLLARQGCIHV